MMENNILEKITSYMAESNDDKSQPQPEPIPAKDLPPIPERREYVDPGDTIIEDSESPPEQIEPEESWDRE